MKFVKTIFVFFVILLVSLANNLLSQNYPFPQSLTYSYGIKPNISQVKMNQSVEKIYDMWKSKYLYDRGSDGSGHQMYSVNCSESNNGDTVSEGQGYGMLIMAIMSGYDTSSKDYFDGMYWFFKKYINSHGLMKWYVDNDGSTPKGTDNATDGDLDIAYALVLADKQWGSSGTINYIQEAITLISNIFYYNVDGDGIDTANSSEADYNIRWGDQWGSLDIARPSDFMMAHFRVFATLVQSQKWTNSANSVLLRSYTYLSANISGNKLISDFADTSGGGIPVTGQVLESPHDKDYHYNACRVPWRIGTDYVLNGDNRATAILETMVSFIENDTGGDPSKIVDGYQLDGTAYGSYPSLAFVAPFGVAAMVSNSHQNFLDSIFNYCISAGSQGYYEDSINFLSMLVMSGNWWNPLNTISHPYVTALISPTDGVKFTPGQTIQFQWLPRTGVNKYKLEISTLSDFSTLLSGFPIESTGLTYSSASLKAGKYYWRISTSTNSGTSWIDSSATGEFSVKSLVELGQLLTFPTIFTKDEQLTVDYKIKNDLLPLVDKSKTKFAVYNLYGEKIFEKEIAINSGEFITTWDGKLSDGSNISSGLYIIKIYNDYFENTTRVIYK